MSPTKIARLRAFEDAIDVVRRLPVLIGLLAEIVHQAAFVHKTFVRIDRREPKAARIPRNAFGERHFASGGIRREGQGRFAGSVYFPPQIASLFDARGQTLVSEPRDVHGGQEEKILCEGGRCFYCSISISTKTPPDVVPKLPGESFL